MSFDELCFVCFLVARYIVHAAPLVTVTREGAVFLADLDQSALPPRSIEPALRLVQFAAIALLLVSRELAVFGLVTVYVLHFPIDDMVCSGGLFPFGPAID